MIPLFVVADGRSGTTLLMRLLASHPAIVAYEEYPLEFRPTLFSLYPENPILQPFPLNAWKFEGSRELLFEPMAAHGGLPLESVGPIYAAIASAMGKSPRYYVEKCPVGLDLARLAQRLPRFRCLLLVRDPRDIVLSARAFNRKRGSYDFREQKGATVEEHIAAFRHSYDHVAKKLASIAGAHLVRYEELALDGLNALRGIFDWLGIESSDGLVEACMRRAAQMETGEHRTSASLEASVGRWRREMPADWHAYFAKHLGPALARFGYLDDRGGSQGPVAESVG